MVRRVLHVTVPEVATVAWTRVVTLAAPPLVAPSAGVPVELDGIGWAEYRGGDGMFTVTDPGVFQRWTPRGRL